MLHHGDCLEVLKTIPENSIDSIVTDPPYGLAFMGKKWDYDVPSVDVWKEVLRVLKPGGHLLSFGGTRTYHRMVVAIEDAGFEIRDQVQWIYGSGFPKSLNVLKAIEREYECRFLNPASDALSQFAHSLLELREEKTGSVRGNVVIPHEAENASLMVIGEVVDSSGQTVTCQLESTDVTCLNIATLLKSISVDPLDPKKKYITETKLGTITDSKILSLLPRLNTLANICGVGSALKPANEPIVLARKPLCEKTVAANVLKWGTGGINVDGCRVSTSETLSSGRHTTGDQQGPSGYKTTNRTEYVQAPQGRFPSNLLLDETAAEMLNAQTGTLKSGAPGIKRSGNDGPAYGSESRQPGTQMGGFGDSGGASRFFYVAKSSKRERNEGLDEKANVHPTVKPITLMRYLCRLITPPGGIVLDPFAGSGSTGVAALKEGFQFVGIERELEYIQIAEKRLEHARKSEKI